MGREYNPVFGRDPWHDLCTFTADSAVAAYPASNLGNMDFNRVWRSNAALTVNLRATLSRVVPIGFLGMVHHNASQGATFRLRLYSDAAWTTKIYDSDTDDDLVGDNLMFPPVYSDAELEVEDDNWWTATWRDDELENRRRHRFVWLNGDLYLTQSFEVDIVNETNPQSDYLQMGALIPCRGHQMSKGIALGSSRGHESTSRVTQADGGKEYGEQRLKPRVFQGSFQNVTRAEADEVVGEMKDRHDITPNLPVLFHPFPREPRQWLRSSFPARFASLDLNQYATPARDTVPVNLREIL